jgi:DNA-binding GntR family transcriptional regulator
MNKAQVYEEIKKNILSEALAPGQWLVERDISEKYRISRTPVRELLRALASDGLVALEPSKGYSVKKLNIEEIVEIFQAREAVEGAAARLSCIRGDTEFFDVVAKLKAQLQKLDLKQDSSLGIAKGTELHDAVITAANNAILTEFYQKLKNLNGLIRNLTKKSTTIETKSKENHLIIAQAILEKDGKKSEQFMRQHLSITCKLLVDEYLKHQSGFM